MDRSRTSSGKLGQSKLDGFRSGLGFQFGRKFRDRPKAGLQIQDLMGMAADEDRVGLGG
jgi:hypothetical protein